MIKAPRASIAALVVGLTLGCSVEPNPDEQFLSPLDKERIRRETQLKTEIAQQTFGGANWTDAQVALNELSLAGVPISPAGIVELSGRLYLIDNGRRVLVTWDGSSRTVSTVPTAMDGQSLELPFDLQEYDGRLYVADTSRVWVIDPASGPISSTRFFDSAVTLLPLAGGRIVWNRLNVNPAGAELRLVTNEFATVATFAAGDNPTAGSAAAYGMAQLARCGDQIGVAYRHKPRVLLLSPELQEPRDIKVAFPGMDQLLASDRSASRSPNEQLGWHPRYFSGIACSAKSMFVLLDLPVLRIYQFTLDGRFETVIGADVATVDQGFARLATSDTESGFPLYSIARGRDGTTRVAVISVQRGQVKSNGG